MPDIWEPHPGKQTEALSRSESEILYGGARGGGKTESGLAWMVEPEYIRNPLYKGLVIRKNADDLSDWLARARTFYRGFGVITGKPAVITFKSGAFIRTGHLKDEDAFNKYLGHEYHKILIEELTQIAREEDYLKLISTNRSTVPELLPQTFATTNPGGVGHKWVKARFIDKANMKTYRDPVSGKTRIFIPSRVDDNPTLMKNDPNYLLFLETLPERLKRAWRYGDWNAFEGQFFEDFNPDKQAVDPFKIPDEWPLYAGIDPGWSSPCSLTLRAKDFEGNSYLIFTYYESGKSPQQHAETILSMFKGNPYTGGRIPDLIVSGHDAFAKKDRFSIISHELTFADIFAQYGLYLQRANTDRHNGWWAIKQMQRSGKWFYFNGMNDALTDEMVSVEGDSKDPEDILGKGNDPNVSDHALDADRYNIMAQYTPVEVKIQPKIIAPKSLVSFEELTKEIKNRNRRNDIRAFWQ